MSELFRVLICARVQPARLDQASGYDRNQWAVFCDSSQAVSQVAMFLAEDLCRQFAHITKRQLFHFRQNGKVGCRIPLADEQGTQLLDTMWPAREEKLDLMISGTLQSQKQTKVPGRWASSTISTHGS